MRPWLFERARTGGGRHLANLIAAALLVAGCSGGTATSPSAAPASPTAARIPEAPAQRGRDGTLTLFFWQAPTTLNPHLSPGTKDYSAARLTYEPLASFDTDGNLIPFLAAEIPSLENGGVAADGTSVTWKLRPDVRWSDGEPFTAEDVRFTWQYATDPEVASTSAAAFGTVKDVVVVDPQTVRVEFKERDPAWATPFVGVQGLILPKHVFGPYQGAAAKDAPPNLAPVGTGPFRVTSFGVEDVLIVGGEAVPTTKILYEANPFYRDPDKPAFSNVVLQGGGGDAAVAVQAITDGTADYAWNLQVDDATAAQVEASGKGRIVAVPGAFVERIMLNFSDPNTEAASGERSSTEHPHPFLTDEAVRQAIALAVDREAIAALYGRGGSATGNILMSPTSMASSRPPTPYDLEAARRLLDEAGWTDHDGDGIRDKDGVALKVLYQTSINAVRQQAQEIVKASLDSIGFDVELKNIDSGVFFGPPEGTTSTRRQFYADLEEFAFSNKVPDPTAYMGAWTCEQAAQQANDWSGSNWSRYCDPAYDALWRQAAAELDPDKRAELFKQLNDYLLDHAAVIPLVRLSDMSGISTSVEGLELTPWDVDPWSIADWHRD